MYLNTLFHGAIILNPSPNGSESVTTPPPNVLNNTPASPYPILTDDFQSANKTSITNIIPPTPNNPPLVSFGISNSGCAMFIFYFM